jgi:hypothetical protein
MPTLRGAILYSAEFEHLSPVHDYVRRPAVGAPTSSSISSFEQMVFSDTYDEIFNGGAFGRRNSVW